jgi:N-methylhydantoinase B
MSVDPILFEVLRHRLWAINEESASAIARISGSPVANEAYDFNTGLMTNSGQVLIVGPYVMSHAAALDCIVEYVIENFTENPGIGKGDMFATNDPYVGANHQADLAVVAPIVYHGETIMWCGSVVHQTDVGGPVAGSVNSQARSIYEEAIPLAPIRLVEGGRIRKDLEREYLIRSRMPGLNALDLRGQIAANRVQTERILELVESYGLDTVMSVVEHLVASTEQRFRHKLSKLPDGTWTAQVLVEHDGRSNAVYRVELEMTKTGSSLAMDFSGTSPQAPALINCSRGTLRGYVLGTLLTLLGYDMSWTPAGLWPAVEVRTNSGTLVDPIWPAGVSVGNQATGVAIRSVVNKCVSTMLDGSADNAERAMAPSMGSFAGQNISGTRSDNTRFGTMLLDSLGGGMGARQFADGLDTGGMLTAPKSSIGNVEINEHNYPILYLWRREAADSGGAGQFRGGVSGEHAYVPHKALGTVESTQFGSGVEQPSTPGILGGEPGSVNLYLCVRGGRDLQAKQLSELDGDWEVLQAKGTIQLEADDVYIHAYSGGGGLGDPLDRDPERVAADVSTGLVTETAAKDTYGVVLSFRDGRARVNLDETASRRVAILRRRLGGQAPRARQPRSPDGERLSLHVTAVTNGDGRRTRCCTHCHTEIGREDQPLLEELVRERVGVAERWSRTATLPGVGRFQFDRYYCPGCGTQMEAEVVWVDGDGDGDGAEPVR